MLTRPARAFLGRWIAIVAAGEAAGFAIATGVALTVILLALPPAVAVPATIAGGTLEGLVLGSAQYAAMRANRPPRARWVLATAGAAALAWTLGMLPSSLGLDLAQPGTWLLVGTGGILLLASIPVAQALVLRRRGSVAWALVNAGAWAVAILWTFVPSPIIDERSPVPLVATLYVLAGLLMATTVAVLTAPLAARLFSRPED